MAGHLDQVILLVWPFACEMSICEQNKIKSHALLFFSLYVFWYDFGGIFRDLSKELPLPARTCSVIYVPTLNF